MVHVYVNFHITQGDLNTGLFRGLSGKKKKIPLVSKRHGFDPWSGRAPGEGSGNPRQYPCLGNPMDRGTWQATVHGIAKELDMT